MSALFTMLTGLFPQNWSEIRGIGSHTSVGITFDTKKMKIIREKREESKTEKTKEGVDKWMQVGGV